MRSYSVRFQDLFHKPIIGILANQPDLKMATQICTKKIAQKKYHRVFVANLSFQVVTLILKEHTLSLKLRVPHLS